MEERTSVISIMQPEVVAVWAVRGREMVAVSISCTRSEGDGVERANGESQWFYNRK